MYVYSNNNNNYSIMYIPISILESDSDNWKRRIRFVIVLDSCCISIGLVFIKDRPVSSFWVLRFRSRVLRFRDLGASFSRFGCFVLRSSFSSASFSKLPL